MGTASVLGKTTVVRGNVRGTGALEVHGRIEGDVSVTGELVLAEDSTVLGDVTGAHVTIAGAVQGDVRATDAVMLEQGARVIGDLTAPRVGVVTGALVRGVVRTDGEPPLVAGRRPSAAQAPRGAVTYGAKPPKPEPVRDTEEPDEPPADEPMAARDAPPPPVVPALAKGARAKKKKKG